MRARRGLWPAKCTCRVASSPLMTSRSPGRTAIRVRGGRSYAVRGWGAAQRGLGEVIAKQCATEERDGRYASEQAQVGAQWSAVEDLGRGGGAQERGGPLTRRRKQRG